MDRKFAAYYTKHPESAPFGTVEVFVVDYENEEIHMVGVFGWNEVGGDFKSAAEILEMLRRAGLDDLKCDNPPAHFQILWSGFFKDRFDF